MSGKKIFWDGMFFLAILFLIFMFGIDYQLGPLPHFAVIPAEPTLATIKLKSIEIKEDVFEQEGFSKQTKLPLLSQVIAYAQGWVVQIKVTESSAEVIKKLQLQSWPAFNNPMSSEKAPYFIFVGPYVKKQKAEQVAQSIKNTLGLAGDVVKFNPVLSSQPTKK